MNTLAQNDTLLVMESKDDGGKIKKTVYVTESVTGNVDSVSSDGSVVISGTEYNCTSNVNTQQITANKGVLAGLDMYGNVVCLYYNADKDLLYGYVVGANYDAGLAEKMKIKLLTDRGIWQVMEFAENFKLNGKKGTVKLLQSSAMYNGAEFVPQLVSYRANSDGKIIAVNVAGEPVGHVERQEESTLNLNASYSTGQKRVYRYTLGGEYCLDPTMTSIFLIAKESNGTINEEMSNIIPYSAIKNNTTPAMKLYDADYTCIPKALVYEITVPTLSTYLSTTAGSYRSNCFVVDRVVNQLNEDGEEVTVLSGYDSGTYRSKEVYEGVDVSYLKRGDVITYRLVKDKIYDVILRFSTTCPAGYTGSENIFAKTLFLDRTYTEADRFKASDNNYISGYTHLFATLKDKITSNGINVMNVVCMGCTDSTSLVISGGAVIKYNSKQNELYLSNYDEVEYNKPMLVFSTYGTVTAIVQYD